MIFRVSLVIFIVIPMIFISRSVRLAVDLTSQRQRTTSPAHHTEK